MFFFFFPLSLPLSLSFCFHVKIKISNNLLNELKWHISKVNDVCKCKFKAITRQLNADLCFYHMVWRWLASHFHQTTHQWLSSFFFLTALCTAYLRKSRALAMCYFVSYSVDASRSNLLGISSKHCICARCSDCVRCKISIKRCLVLLFLFLLHSSTHTGKLGQN